MEAKITHPFHPWHGREFALVTYRNNWGEDRVYFHDRDGRLVSVPACWTSLLAPDPSVAVSQGRSPFRFQDLLEMVELIDEIRKRGRE